MQRYWDLSEKQRSALSRDELEHYIDIELMEAGVVRPKPPKLEALEEVQLETRIYYGIVKDSYQSPEFVFESESDAALVAASRPLWLHDDYQTKAKWAEPCPDVVVKPITVATQQSAVDARVRLLENAERKQRNDQAERDYSKACEAMEKAASSLISDWHECLDKARRCAAVAATFDEYRSLTAGNDGLARTFLLKAYAPEEVEAAFSWVRQQ